MATAIALDASPLNVLRSIRGSIAYPKVLHVEIKAGELWHLAAQDAEWSPSDPGVRWQIGSVDSRASSRD